MSFGTKLPQPLFGVQRVAGMSSISGRSTSSKSLFDRRSMAIFVSRGHSSSPSAVSRSFSIAATSGPAFAAAARQVMRARSEEHTSELQSLMRISYAVFCLKKKKKYTNYTTSPLQISTYKTQYQKNITNNM